MEEGRKNLTSLSMTEKKINNNIKKRDIKELGERNVKEHERGADCKTVEK